MRLIHTTSIKLTEFVGTKFPPYVILSHTWGVGEVLYSDIQDGTAPDKNGYAKLLGCCKKAREDGYDWAWIDTCCIDKTSSAELSEAINSMFAWYRDADICYAYLQDVSDGWPVSNIPGSQSQRFRSRVDDFDPFLRTSPERLATPTFPPSDYCQSKWFTRGWTLQELIAPRAVEFYTAKWEEIGTKATLAAEVSSTTGIPVRILRGDKLTSCNVAERLSWASARKTTRVEDMAYSLLGLFGISMPLLYGEGVKSFVRLQQHILEQEDDCSILAWVPQCNPPFSPGYLTGCLASAPSEFARTALKHLYTPIPGHPRWTDHIPNYEKYLIQYSSATKNYDQMSRSELGKVRNRALDPRGTHDPPRLTSRGLRISLFMKPLNIGHWIAWTYYEFQGQLICISLQRSSKWPELFGRRFAPWLTTVDKALFDQFEQKEIFLYPNGNLAGIDPGPEFIQPTILSDMGRLRIETAYTESHKTYVVSSHPPKVPVLPGIFWEPEFVFQEKPEVVAVILFEVIYKNSSLKDCPRGRFEVACGFHSELAWCNISEELRSLDGVDEDALTSAFKRRQAQEDEAFDDLTDRAARRSTLMPGTIISAKIRHRSAAQCKGADYTVEVRVSEEGCCEKWADLCLAAKAFARVQRQAELMA